MTPTGENTLHTIDEDMRGGSGKVGSIDHQKSKASESENRIMYHNGFPGWEENEKNISENPSVNNHQSENGDDDHGTSTTHEKTEQENDQTSELETPVNCVTRSIPPCSILKELSEENDQMSELETPVNCVMKSIPPCSIPKELSEENDQMNELDTPVNSDMKIPAYSIPMESGKESDQKFESGTPVICVKMKSVPACSTPKGSGEEGDQKSVAGTPVKFVKMKSVSDCFTPKEPGMNKQTSKHYRIIVVMLGF